MLFGKKTPQTSNTYTKTIASKIFNFSSTLSGLDYHQFHNSPSWCECNTSSHLYQLYGSVITGDHYAGINLTGYHPPGHPGAFAPKCVPSPRAFALQKMPGGRANK